MPPFIGVKALVKLRLAKVGVEVVVRFWLIVLLPVKRKLKEPKLKVPDPD